MFKTIKEDFLIKQEQEPNMGGYVVLCYVVKNKNYPRATLSKCLSQLVPTSEYSKEDKKELIDYLVKITVL